MFQVQDVVQNLSKLQDDLLCFAWTDSATNPRELLSAEEHRSILSVSEIEYSNLSSILQ
jgi:hypothetical protein